MPSEASPVLGQSWRLWQASDIPYESAQARLHYAEALAAEGDEAMARRDLRAPGRSSSDSGRRGTWSASTPCWARAARRLRCQHRRTGPADRVTRTFMFTDIVTSTDLVGLIGDEAWSELLRWHDRELRSALAPRTAARRSRIPATGSSWPSSAPADAIECAVDIQRRLARHRHEHGFAPWVRIGLHAAEATRTGRNFSGRGVHVAARVGAAAERDEILVTSAALEAAGNPRFHLGAPRPLKLKGVAEPVDVVSVAWR